MNDDELYERIRANMPMSPNRDYHIRRLMSLTREYAAIYVASVTTRDEKRHVLALLEEPIDAKRAKVPTELDVIDRVFTWTIEALHTTLETVLTLISTFLVWMETGDARGYEEHFERKRFRR